MTLLSSESPERVMLRQLRGIGEKNTEANSLTSALPPAAVALLAGAGTGAECAGTACLSQLLLLLPWGLGGTRAL